MFCLTDYSAPVQHLLSESDETSENISSMSNLNTSNMGTDQPNYDTVIISSTTEYEDSNTCDVLEQVQRTSFEMVAESTESCSSKVSGNVHSQQNCLKLWKIILW